MEPLTAANIIQPETELTRRNVLQAAAGMGLSFMLPALESHAANKRGSERMKSMIVLWMGGGPSQLETWDPHPGPKIGGMTGAIPTKIAGLSIADMYPQMAGQIDSLNVIRSIVSKEGDHERGTYFLKTGFRPDPTLTHPALGAILMHELPDDRVEIPQHISLGGGNKPARGGFLGDRFDAFKVFNPGRNIQNMRAPVDDKRQSRRLKNLDVVSQAFQRGRGIQVKNSLHQLTVERALRMMTSDQLKAFEIDDEPKQLQQAYGDHRFGRGCLVARRLVEQGVRAIEVTLMGWDSHANNYEGHRTQADILDPAFASLIKDLKKRDLLDSTLVLCIGEFGRTPKINALDGRDHWPTGFSCVVGGGGLKSGVAIGATDPTGEKKAPEDPIEVKDLYATVLKKMGVEYDREFVTPIGRPMAFSYGTPITRLM